MKNLTDLIKENNENKKFKYVATVVGMVISSDEIEATEDAIKNIDMIDGLIDVNMVSIEEDSTIESIQAQGIRESHEAKYIVDEIYNTVMSRLADVSEEEKKEIISLLRFKLKVGK